MNRKHKITISITAITIILLALIGLTYGYFLTRITGNDKEKSISVTTANLALVYGNDDGSIIGDGETIEPGKVFEPKTFTVENKGNAKIDNYAVILENYKVVYASTIGEEIKDTSTTLTYPGDFNYTITCKVYDAEEYNANPEEATLKDQKEYSGTLPNSNDILLYNSIDLKEIHVYEFNLVYEETKTDQSADMNKRIEGKLNIIDTTKTIDVEGDVTNYEKGDYVQTNSIQRISQIDSEGKYKIVGLEPGEHTIRVFNASGEAKGSKTFTIQTGETAGISGEVITIDDKSRTFTIDIDATNEIYTIGTSIKKTFESSFSKGTLAYSILDNAVNITEEQKELGYAEYRDKPLTIPAVEGTMTYVENEPTAEKTYNYFSTKTFTSTNAANYYITYGDTYSYTTNHTIKNKDGSSLKAVLLSTGYETLIGKYIVSPSGNTSSTPVSGSEKSTIYYVMNATATTIDFINVEKGIAKNERYITYGESYEFDIKSGTYKLNNVKVLKYNEGYNELVGKYVVNLYGNTDENPKNSTNLQSIYLVTENSTNIAMTYKELTKNSSALSHGSAESSLTTTIDDYGISYYYRGAVKNNYLEFNNMCWRIVRIEGDGSIKIVLAAEKKCNKITSDDTKTAFIGNGNFGYITDYVINSSGETSTTKAKIANYLNIDNSTYSMKYKLEQWLTSSAIDTGKLKKEKWCLGNTVDAYDSSGILLTSSTPDLMYNKTTFYYDAYVRLYGKGQTANATLKCNSNNYKYYESHIGTLAADEIVFAGKKMDENYNDNNGSYYLIENAQNTWWTLTPSYFRSQYNSDVIIEINDTGSSFYDEVYENKYIRPVITLKTNILITGGNGSITNPYTIK